MKKYLMVMLVTLNCGCATSNYEERIQKLEEQSAIQNEAIYALGSWARGANAALDFYGTFLKQQSEILKKMNADGVRVQ